MRKCNLAGVNLEQKILDMADLSYSNISGANLKGVSFRGTNLRCVDLSKSISQLARFDQFPLDANRQWPTNLWHAIFCGSDLAGASFAGAILTKTDLRGCNISSATFIGTDLTTAKMDKAASVTSGQEKRGYPRYSEPELYIRTEYGAFTSINWSIGGVCMNYPHEDRMGVGEELWASIVAKGYPPPRQTQFTVIRDVPDKGLVYLKFSSMADDIRQYIEELAEKSIELNKRRIVSHRYESS